MSKNYYNIEKMEGYYRIGSPENVFSYVIVGDKQAALIDTGYGFGDLKEAVRSITSLPLYIFNTHGHCDHTGGNGLFHEDIFIHPKDMDLCRQHNEPQMRRENALRSKDSINYETGEHLNGLPEDFDENAYISRDYGHLVPVKEGDTFDLGQATLMVMETPGHTQGGISLYYKEKNLLFVGDAAGAFVWLFSPESTDMDTYIHVLEKMYNLGADGYIGAHNPQIMHKEDFLLYIRAAKEADYEKGLPFNSFAGNENEPRVCPLEGFTMEDMFKPGFASVVIGKN